MSAFETSRKDENHRDHSLWQAQDPLIWLQEHMTGRSEETRHELKFE